MGILEIDDKSSIQTTKMTSKLALAPRQAWDWAATTSDLTWSSPKPTGAYGSRESSVDTLSSFHSYFDVPKAATMTETRSHQPYTHPRDRIGSRSTFFVLGVIGAVVLVIIVGQLLHIATDVAPLPVLVAVQDAKKIPTPLAAVL